MKALKIKVFSFILIISFFIGIPCVMAQVQYLGDYCWEITNVGTVKVGVTLIGDGHYLLVGRMTTQAGAIRSIHGCAEVDGDNIVFTFMNSGKDESGIWTSTAHGIGNLSTLNGTLDTITFEKDPPFTPETSIEHMTYGTETITHITCP